MRRYLLLLALPVLCLLHGCTPDVVDSPERKAQLEKMLPELITQELHNTAAPTNSNAKALCTRVVLTRDSRGHYVGEAYYADGAHAEIKVVDDGQNAQFDVAPS